MSLLQWMLIYKIVKKFRLYRLINEEDWDISRLEKETIDPITKTIPTKLYNWAARKAFGIYLHDFNCGLKSYKRCYKEH